MNQDYEEMANELWERIASSAYGAIEFDEDDAENFVRKELVQALKRVAEETAEEWLMKSVNFPDVIQQQLKEKEIYIDQDKFKKSVESAPPSRLRVMKLEAEIKEKDARIAELENKVHPQTKYLENQIDLERAQQRQLHEVKNNQIKELQAHIEELEKELELAKASIRDVCDEEIRILEAKNANLETLVKMYNSGASIQILRNQNAKLVEALKFARGCLLTHEHPIAKKMIREALKDCGEE